MTPENKQQLVNRFKSFLWRAVMMLGALLIDWILENIGLFALPAQATIVIGLLLGELSKWLNTGRKPSA